MDTRDLQAPKYSKTPLEDLGKMIDRSGYDSSTLWKIIERGGESRIQYAADDQNLCPCDVINMRRLVRITNSWFHEGRPIPLSDWLKIWQS